MMPPSYPIHKLILVFAASFLIIGIADASFYQVEEGTTVQASNYTEISLVSTGGYLEEFNLSMSDNTYGYINASILVKELGVGIAYVGFMKNVSGVNYLLGSNQSTTSSTYSYLYYTGNQYLNSTDILSFYVWCSSAAGCGYKDAELKFDYITQTITNPANNSAQTSRILNTTWTSTGSPPYQYNISQNSDCSSPYITGTTSELFSGNQTLISGLSHICVRGYNITEDSITNWSDPMYIYISDTITSYGGSGYNWSLNLTFNYSTWDRGDNIIWGSHSYRNNFAGGDCSGLNNSGSSYGCNIGSLWMNHSSGSTQFLTVNETNYTNTDVLIAYTQTYDGGNPANGAIIRSDVDTMFPLVATNQRETLRKMQIAETAGSLSDLTASQTMSYSFAGLTHYVRLRVNGTTYMYKSWNSSESEIDWWSDTNTTYDVLSYGRIGVRNNAGNISVSSITSVYIDTFGNIINQSDVQTGVIDSQYQRPIFIESNLTFGSGSYIQVYINASDDNITFSETQIGNHSVTGTYYDEVPSSHQKRYYKVKYVFNTGYLGYGYRISRVTDFSVLLENRTYISGYVLYPNGTGINSAVIGYYGNWSNTDASGFYEFFDIPTGDFVITAGMTGYNSSGELINVSARTSYYQNFSLGIVPSYIDNVFWNRSHILVNHWIPSLYANGSQNISALMPEQITYPDCLLTAGVNIESRMMSELLAGVYHHNINRTPLFLERTISSINNRNSTLLIEPVDDTDHHDYRMLEFLRALYYIRPYINDSAFEKWNTTVRDFNISFYGENNGVEVEDQFNASNTTELSNHMSWVANAEYLRFLFGALPNTTNTDVLVDKFVNYTTDNGYIDAYEASPSTLYNTVWVYNFIMLNDYGYTSSNPDYLDKLNLSIEFTRNMEIVDGYYVPSGRAAGGIGSYGKQMFVLISDTSGNISENYRRMDRFWQKMNQTVGWYDGTYNYNAQSHFHPSLTKEFSIPSTVEALFAEALLMVGDKYDPSILEAPVTHPSVFNDTCFNCSGIMLLNNNVSSAWMFREHYVGSTNGSIILPLRFSATVLDAYTSALSYNPQMTDGTSDFPIFTDPTTTLNITNSTFTENNYSIGTNSMWVNWSNISYGSHRLYNVNMSVTLDEPLIHVKHEFVFNQSDFLPGGFRIPIVYLQSDNITNSTVDISGLDVNYSHGYEVFNITNMTSNADTLTVVDYNTTVGNLNSFGVNGVLYIEGTISDDFTVEYDLNISTSNTYGYILNQPPSVYDFSPATPLTTTTGTEQDFEISFTQNDVDVSWQINGTEVQTNLSVSGGTTVYYTNASGVTGFWNLSAIGCNAQGCAMQTWDWTVEEPIISFTKAIFEWWD